MSYEWQRGQCTETVITWKPQIVAEYHKSQLFKGITLLSYQAIQTRGHTLRQALGTFRIIRCSHSVEIHEKVIGAFIEKHMFY
ncbi:hypothetical protein CE195_02995 [Sodalis-like symbiont of Philaenus spumarius]|nr:hypothetical protein CE195_02995 [Sodalis-like symbiont of Philaenus spumarius]